MHSILHWNCRGLRTSAQELQALVQRSRPVAICLQETKLSPDSHFAMRGYSVFRKDLTASTVAHGGVALAVHHSVPASHIPLRSPLQAVAARLHVMHRDVTICSVYLPPGIALPLSELRRLMLELPSPVVLLGDFNAHNSAWGSENTDTRGRLLESFIHDHSLCVLNSGTRTHFTLPSGQTSVLDLSIVSPDLTSLFAWDVHDEPLGSDHFPVWLKFLGQPVMGNRPRKWKFDKADWAKFENDLDAAILARGEEISAEEFTSLVLEVAAGCIPRTSSFPRHTPVPWWSDDCKKALRARKRAFKAFDRNCTVENLIAFRKARASARRVVKDAKRDSWRKYVTGLNRLSSLSDVWARIHRISGKSSAVPLPVLRIGNRDVLHPAEVANEIATALSERSRGDNVDPRFLQHRVRSERRNIDFTTSDPLFYNSYFTMAELVAVTSTLRDVAEGPDGIHNIMIRHLPRSALRVLLFIYNSLWEKGEFPPTWREATVIPIPKPGKSGLDPLHYRPISLTSALCKVMEKMVNSRLTWFLEKKDFFAREQCGFRKFRSTVDHILTLDTVVRSAFKQKQHVGAIFYDIEAAYDTTWRHGIISKLFKCGIRGSMGVFLKNFLSERSFKVRVGNQQSEKYIQENGVPQGGVLSVALFAVMVNDIGDELPQSVGRALFVDDFSIWCRASSSRAISRQLQLASTRLERWGMLNGFRFSTSKTTAVHFCRRRLCSNWQVFLYGRPIPVKPFVKFLGVYMDSRLTYKHHFKVLRERCFKSMNVLKCVSRTSYGADRSTLLLLYRSMIRSKLDYACFIYDSASETSKRALDTIHHTSLRIATGAFRTSPTSSLLVDANEPPLAHRRQTLGMRYALRLRQLPDHPAYPYVFAGDVLTIFDGMTQREMPFCLRMRDLFDISGVSPRDVTRIALTPHPPWELVYPEMDLSLTEVKKGEVLQCEFHIRAMEHMASYDGRCAVFTDGSKGAEGVGCAFVAGRDTRSFSLPANASVFTSELTAILKALCFIEVGYEDRHVIFTDSLSGLLAIRTVYPKHPLVQDILVRLTALDEAGKSVTFCWIPSHVGIRGNELADAAARRAAAAPCTRRFPLPARDFFSAISRFGQSRWQGAWEAQRSSKLRLIKPLIRHWPSAMRRNRQEEVLLCRLRIGHTYATHGYLLRGEDKPLCTTCRTSLTVGHVLLVCPKYAVNRTRYLGHISRDTTVQHLLGDDSRWVQSGAIFAFIKSLEFAVIYTAF